MHERCDDDVHAMPCTCICTRLQLTPVADVCWLWRARARFVIDKMESIVECLRSCNVTLRWALLQRRTKTPKIKELLAKGMHSRANVLQFMLSTVRARPHGLRGLLSCV